MSRNQIRNGGALPLKDVPILEPQVFRQLIIERVEKRHERLASMFASNAKEDRRVQVFAILANDAKGTIYITRTFLQDEAFESNYLISPSSSLIRARDFRRQYSVRIEGHPWLKPVRFHPHKMSKGEWKGGFNYAGPAVMNFFDVKGEQVHEVAVGPVHAAVH